LRRRNEDKRQCNQRLRRLELKQLPRLQSDVIVEVGVDYLTCTFVGRQGESSLASFGRYLVHEEMARGEKWRDFRFSGYRGEHCGASSFGYRHDGEILRISSHVAKEHWAQAFALATNVTRIDVQVTVRPEGGPTKRLLNHHRTMRRKRRGRGRPPSFKFWYGPDGPEAATFGKRSSDVFARAYDKGVESGLPEYSGTLRYETELKRRLAVEMCVKLDEAVCSDSQIVQYVSKFATIRGLQTGIDASEFERLALLDRLPENRRHEDFECHQISSSAPANPELLLGQGKMRRSASWLHNSVRPSVQKLLAMGHREVVLSALGLSVERSELQSTERELWSNFNNWR
jgi:hypothetical protein